MLDQFHDVDLVDFRSGKPGGLGSLTGAQSVSFRQGSNVEFGVPAHERMVYIQLLKHVCPRCHDYCWKMSSLGTSGRGVQSR